MNRFLLHITFAAADPYDAVMAYGAANMALAAAGRRRPAAAFNVRSSDVETGVDFSSEKPTLEAGLTVTISLARIIARGGCRRRRLPENQTTRGKGRKGPR